MSDQVFLDGLKRLEISDKPGRIERCESNFKRFLSEGGKVSGPLLMLMDALVAQTLQALFKQGDIEQAKKSAFDVGRVLALYSHFYPADMGKSPDSQLLYPLISDSPELIHWGKQYFIPLLRKSQGKYVCDNINNPEFHALQLRLALAGDWGLLKSRAEAFLSGSPKKYKLYAIDCRFYIALCEGNIHEMEAAISELLSPKVLRHRDAEPCWGLEYRLFSPWPFILSKIAFINGFCLDVHIPNIPGDILRVSPLKSYSSDLDILEEVSLFAPFSDVEEISVKNLKALSPRSMSSSILIFGGALKVANKEHNVGQLLERD
ncbi:hypothetical protein [Microbulbifer sp. PSTR4-B]|uniref:hypothetical protein n=1 Tax=Microbulbifer sp. PSTR4-B TaxID=3243396 RepID=UPI00403965C8